MLLDLLLVVGRRMHLHGLWLLLLLANGARLHLLYLLLLWWRHSVRGHLEHRRILREHAAHNRDHFQEVAGGRTPLIEVREIDRTEMIDVQVAILDPHVSRGSHEARRRSVRVLVPEPDSHGDVVGSVLVVDRSGASETQESLGGAIGVD